METVAAFIFLGSKITADGDCSHEIKRHLLLGRKPVTNLDRVLNSKDITLLTKVRIVKAIVFPVVMCECESWTIRKAELKNWCFLTMVLMKSLESPLDYREIKPINPNWNQPWVFIGRADVEAKAPILWPPNVKSYLIGEDPDAGKDWRQGKKGITEDKIFGWHHWLSGHDFEKTLGDGKGQGSLACCSLWGCKMLDMT